jgi:hypothetical protein
MTTLTKNRILEKGDQFFNGTGWVPVPATDLGLQVQFVKYKEIRRPSEAGKDLPAPVLAEPKELSPIRAAKAELSEARAGGEARESTLQTRTTNEVVAGSPPRTVADSRGGQTLSKPISPESEKPPSGAIVTPMAESEPKAAPSIHSDGAAGSRLATTICFGETEFPPLWTGRNGTFHGYAIACAPMNPDKIILQPVGKRGVGNCMIEFPKAIIPQLVDWLLQQELTK